MPSAKSITRAEFDEALARYPDLLQSISSSKTQNKGELTLVELDKYRFEIAPGRYFKKEELEDSGASPTPISHADVVQLVKWKLKHGVFRPNLMKLAESNGEDEIQTVTKEAFAAYKENGFSVTKAINKLTTLKGIGPATASLILSIHDPSKVVFFSDEVFLWICRDSKKGPIKYSLKEYQELVTESQALLDRLGVDARALEQVGFVLMKAGAGQTNGLKTVKEKSTETKKRDRNPKPLEPKEPTDMTVERKSQLVEVAARGRAARVAKKQAKLEKGTKFRERVDAARAKKIEDPSALDAGEATGVKRKRKSDVTKKETASPAKRGKK